MGVPEYSSLEAGIRAVMGENVSIVRKSYVGGGDINEAMCLMLSNGEEVFVKENSIAHRDFFDQVKLVSDTSDGSLWGEIFHVERL